MAKHVLSTNVAPDWTKEVIGSLKAQLHGLRYAIGLAVIGMVIGFVPVVLLITLRKVDPELLTRDIFASTNAPIYTAFLSNLGLFVWAAAAAIWFLSAVLMARVDLRYPQLLFAVGSMLFSTLMLFDDAFMFHEMVIPDYLGISEKNVMIMYALLSISYVGLNVRHILRSPYVLLVIAVGLLGMSVALDVLMPMTSMETLVEDGFKFAGIIFWAVYAGTTAVHIVDDIVARRA